jgi:hypothetical protein
MPHPTSCAAVVADTIVRTVELGVTITDAPLDADTTVSYYNLLDIGRRHCVRVRTGRIGRAGPRCPAWTVLQ